MPLIRRKVRQLLLVKMTGFLEYHCRMSLPNVIANFDRIWMVCCFRCIDQMMHINVLVMCWCYLAVFLYVVPCVVVVACVLDIVVLC